MIAARDDRADDLADFVVMFRMSPDEYRSLTIRERDAIIRAERRLNRGHC